MIDTTYLTFLNSVIQVIAAFMGIIAVILIFIMDIKLGQAKNIWDELSIKYSNNELNKINVKRYLILYNSKLLDVRLDPFFANILVVFYTLSSFILIYSLFILIVGCYSSESLYIFILMLLLIGVFLILIYQILNAPFSRIFNKWKIEHLLKQPQYSFLSDYIGSLDVEDVKILFSSRNNLKGDCRKST